MCLSIKLLTSIGEQLESVGLPDLRANGDLEGMPLLQRGQRLSVQPVSEAHFRIVCTMGGLDNLED